MCSVCGHFSFSKIYTIIPTYLHKRLGVYNAKVGGQRHWTASRNKSSWKNTLGLLLGSLLLMDGATISVILIIVVIAFICIILYMRYEREKRRQEVKTILFNHYVPLEDFELNRRTVGNVLPTSLSSSNSRTNTPSKQTTLQLPDSLAL